MKPIQKYTIKNSDLIVSPEWLKGHSACPDGYKWALPVIGEGVSLSEMLPKFDRADWMLWTLRKADALEKVQSVRCAILCAESVLGIFEKKYPDDKRPRKAIEAAIRYCEKPTEENRVAYAAAYADAYAYADASAAYAASSAAYAAADAYASSAAYAAYAAAYAYAYAAADAYADAYASARKSHHKRMCAGILELLAAK